MPWYRQGTVSITAGQTTVVGVGTDFPANSRVGDAFIGPDGNVYELANIASTTVISILPAYQGATVAGGLYGLAPMQGYVKESADRLRQLVDQFGVTLALFGGAADAATLRVNIGAAARGMNSDITSLSGLTTALSIAQGGTGGKTAAEARTGLGLKSAALADIVGSVSQSGGVPTGAIIGRGSNANGQYTQFADGTALLRGSFTTASIPVNSTASTTIQLPIGLNSSETIAPSAAVEPFASLDHYGVTGISSVTSSNMTITVRNGGSGAQQFVVRWSVEGRWF